MKVRKLSIFNQININFRNYAIYTLQNRGIPNFYDSLTNVQKIILLNAPNKSSKTLSLVGDCIKDNYHHGDSSISQAINRLARPFACSENILIGDGFFGTQIKPLAAASRYTSVYLNSKIQTILNKYRYLIERDNEGNYKSLPIDIPIGLLIPIIGIAVGYRTQVLPRKLEHIQEFLANKRKQLIPYFKNFNGKIEQFKDIENSWLIEGEMLIDEEKKVIQILSLPPLMKYEKFIKKIGSILNEYDGCQVINNSKTDVNIKIIFNKFITDDFWEYVKERITKANKLIVKENIVFIKEQTILEYNTVEDYLLDFKNKNIELELKNYEYLLDINKFELSYLEAKIEFLTWLMDKKRTENEINLFLKKYNKNINERLDNIKAKSVNNDELQRTINKKDEILKYIQELKNNIINQKELIQSTDFTLHIKTKKENKIINIENQNEIDGIEIANIDDFEDTFTSEDFVDDDNEELS